MNFSRGILLIALGKESYGRYAYNLALSIKNEDSEIPIAVIHDDTSLNQLIKDGCLDVFDEFIKAKEEDVYYNNQFMPSRFKTLMYDYSPFDETLFFDVDSLWFPGKKVEWLFYEINKLGVDFTSYISNSYFLPDDEKAYIIDWINLKKAADFFNIKEGKVDQINSFLLYFKKTEKNKKYFDKVNEIYDYFVDNNIELNRVWANGQVPDEICFALATNLMNNYCHQEQWRPLVHTWNDLGGGNVEVYFRYFVKYWGLTLPGEDPEKPMISFYNYILGYLNRYSGKPVYKWDGNKFFIEYDCDTCNQMEPKKIIEDNNF